MGSTINDVKGRMSNDNKSIFTEEETVKNVFCDPTFEDIYCNVTFIQYCVWMMAITI